MLRLGEIRSYLDGLKLGCPITIGPDLPPHPGRAVVLTPTGGPGLTGEGFTDTFAFQARVIGEQNSYDSAERLAAQVDSALLKLVTSSQMRFGVWVVMVSRVGSPPSVLVRDDAERHHFVANYLVEVDSGL